jgi:hypothetical protein
MYYGCVFNFDRQFLSLHPFLSTLQKLLPSKLLYNLNKNDQIVDGKVFSIILLALDRIGHLIQTAYLLLNPLLFV